MWRRLAAAVGACALAGVACTPGPGPVAAAPTPASVVALGFATPTPQRTLAVAVAVRSPTATPLLVGDYATLALPRLESIQQNLGHLADQLGVLQKTPLRMADQDWRDQTRQLLEDLLLGEADLRALSPQVGNPVALSTSIKVLKLADDLDFVATEYRMALDYDPDSSHFIRAGRALRSTTDEVNSLLSEVRRTIGTAQPTATPAPSR